MSWFGSGKKGESNFFPVTSYQKGGEKLTEDDTAWKCISNHGFQTETHTYYSVLNDGSILMLQVIWSFLGVFLLPATCQMTFKLWNPVTKKQIWRSINVNGFKHDGRNSKSDAFEIKHTGTTTTEEVYHITATLKDVLVDVKFTKLANAAGWKYGDGYSNFGSQDPHKRDAFVIHRFHPVCVSSGSITLDGKAVDMGGQAMFVHAMQSGMRPNLIASRWNFAFFAGQDETLGKVNAIQMEFTTTDDYGPGGKNSGRTKVNIGCIYASALPEQGLLIVGQTQDPGSTYPVPNKDISTAEHLHTEEDKETGYMAPHGYSFVWEGDRLDGAGRARATAVIDDVWSGLIEKVDVLAEIPKVLRKALASISGTKPFIFQYHSPATLKIEAGDKTSIAKGWIFTEASFISA